MRDIARLVHHIAEGNTHIADRGKIWPDDQVLLPREPNALLPVSAPQPTADAKNQIAMQDNTAAGTLPAQEVGYELRRGRVA